MKPSAIEIRHPPCVPPAMARPMAPQMAAMARRMRSPTTEIVMMTFL